MITVIIPAKNEPHLQKTIDDILQKAETKIEIIAILDGYWPDPPISDDNRVVLIHNTQSKGLREAINQATAIAHGQYLMKCDAHCMFDQGFDRKLLEDYEENTVVVPTRYKLDTDKWEVMDGPPINYGKLVYLASHDKLHGEDWPSREKKNKDILIDENMMFQGSCWFMSKKHWEWIGGLQEYGYGTFTQEPVEIALKTWLGGGKLMVNKRTWYAHQHRIFGRTHKINQEEIEAGNAYALDFWRNNRWTKRVHDFQWLLDRFNV